MLLEFLPLLILFVIYGGIFGLLVYFVFKRLEDKKKENFEKRDN